MSEKENSWMECLAIGKYIFFHLNLLSNVQIHKYIRAAILSMEHKSARVIRPP